MQRAILKYFSYIILHGIKLYNMGWDPSFHTFKAYLLTFSLHFRTNNQENAMDLHLNISMRKNKAKYALRT